MGKENHKEINCTTELEIYNGIFVPSVIGRQTENLVFQRYEHRFGRQAMTQHSQLYLVKNQLVFQKISPRTVESKCHRVMNRKYFQ